MVAPRPSLRHVVLQRRPDLRIRRGNILEFRRHDPQDVVVLPIQSDVAADNRAIACETPAPECVAQDHNVRTVAEILIFAKVPAEYGPDAKHSEIAGTDALAMQPLRLVPTRYRWLPGPDGCDRIK